MTSHKLCKDKADSSTHCSQRFYSNHDHPEKLESMTINRRKAALESVKETITNSEYLRPHRVETFLAVLTNIPDFVDNTIHYSCLAGKTVPEVDPIDPLSIHLRYSHGDESLDTFSVLDYWVEKSNTWEEKYASLKCLEEISKTEKNKKKK